MKLPPRNLNLKPLIVKDKSVLALDTGFDADSLEGMRLVKASRGSGWFYHDGSLKPWTTKGVLQEEKRLLVWGDLEPVPEGSTPAAWPTSGKEGQDFLRQLVLAWTARSETDALTAFTASSVVPYQTSAGWAFAFLPPELQGVLDSLQPLSDRLPWDHFRLPEASGATSWAFASAALGWNLAGALPWAQDDEAHLRQEIRDLKRTLSRDESPDGPDAPTLQLWHDSITNRLGRPAAAWKAWAQGEVSWNSAPADTARSQRRVAAAAKRNRRRSGAAFWRRKGTMTLALGAAALLVLILGGTIAWGILKPDPTDTWTADQAVKGYYAAMNRLDSDQMRKLASFDKDRQPDLAHDQEEATNLYVIRQVRTAYEHEIPVVEAQKWEDEGRPALKSGQILYGVSELEFTDKGGTWAVRYHKWVSESIEGGPPTALGFGVVDELEVKETSRGWKISGLKRQRQPLP